MDEIIRAVRDCPSGALSYAIDGARRATRSTATAAREPAIEVSKDGPYRVTGGIPLTGADGEPEPRAEGASREHYALCRCGHSQNKPFCSGMHWYVDFQDPVPDPDRADDLRVGGRPAGADPDDAAVLREVRPAGPAARAAVRDHVAGPPRARRRVARRGLLRAARATASSTAGTRACCPSTSARASPRRSAPAGCS